MMYSAIVMSGENICKYQKDRIMLEVEGAVLSHWGEAISNDKRDDWMTENVDVHSRGALGIWM